MKRKKNVNTTNIHKNNFDSINSFYKDWLNYMFANYETRAVPSHKVSKCEIFKTRSSKGSLHNIYNSTRETQFFTNQIQKPKQYLWSLLKVRITLTKMQHLSNKQVKQFVSKEHFPLKMQSRKQVKQLQLLWRFSSFSPSTPCSFPTNLRPSWRILHNFSKNNIANYTTNSTELFNP